jgi:hypothetical protein
LINLRKSAEPARNYGTRLPAAVPCGSGLVQARVAANVSCGSRLVQPWVANGTGLPGRSSNPSAAVPCGSGLVQARVAANVSCGSRLVQPWVAANVSCGSRLVQPWVALGLHVRCRSGQKKYHRDRHHPPSNACNTTFRVHDHVLLTSLLFTLLFVVPLARLPVWLQRLREKPATAPKV